tara:strand:- start:2065 stop:3057 length:993 start_codon:yes stop_codon:yes gene_type:complete
MNLIKFPLGYKAILKMLIRLLRGEKYLSYSFYKNTQKSFRNPECFSVAVNKKLAIVMQGPYLAEENFTLESLSRYRKNFPESVIILSTWSIPECDHVFLKQIGVQIILNNKPLYVGFANVNLQIVTTKSGMLLARKLGADYALKTRTDQRIHHPNFYAYLTSMLEVFPLFSRKYSQHSRLVACSLNTFKLRLYGVSDMFLFGHIEDMIRYWDLPLDERIPDGSESYKTWRLLSNAKVSEGYFCTQYLQSIKRDIKYTLDSSLRAISEHFIIIDQHAIGLFWNKYTYDENRYDNGFYNSQLTFNDWLILHSGKGKINFNEAMLDFKIADGR